jgi:two-component system chemotaxis sensor kinase CheA
VTTLSGGREMLRLRGDLLPVVDAQEHLTAFKAVRTSPGAMAVVFETHDRCYALRVGGVVGQMQVVMKPLDTDFSTDVIAGAAILGDGQVALVADVDGLVGTLRDRETKAAAA